MIEVMMRDNSKFRFVSGPRALMDSLHAGEYDNQFVGFVNEEGSTVLLPADDIAIIMESN